MASRFLVQDVLNKRFAQTKLMSDVQPGA